MPIPTAVQKIGDNAEALAVEQGMTGAPGAPANPGESPPLAAVPDPAAQPATEKVDPDNYKERFSRYKTQTDQTIADLRGSLTASQQTITALQSQVQTLTAQAHAAPADPATPVTLPADLSNDPGYKAWFDRLPSEKGDYEDSHLRFLYGTYLAGQQGQKAPDNLAELEQKVDRVAQFQEKTAGQLYEEAMDHAYPNDAWISMASGPDWQDFCQDQVSPVDTRTYGAIVEQGSNSHSANTVIWVLQQYQKHLIALNSGDPGGKPADPLAGQLTPDGAGGGSGDPIEEVNAKAQTFTLSQVNEFYKEAATGNTYTPEQVSSIEKEIQAAQAAGKIIEG